MAIGGTTGIAGDGKRSARREEVITEGVDILEPSLCLLLDGGLLGLRKKSLVGLLWWPSCLILSITKNAKSQRNRRCSIKMGVDEVSNQTDCH